jgi:hypothetical protein
VTAPPICPIADKALFMAAVLRDWIAHPHQMPQEEGTGRGFLVPGRKKHSFQNAFQDLSPLFSPGVHTLLIEPLCLALN